MAWNIWIQSILYFPGWDLYLRPLYLASISSVIVRLGLLWLGTFEFSLYYAFLGGTSTSNLYLRPLPPTSMSDLYLRPLYLTSISSVIVQLGLLWLETFECSLYYTLPGGWVAGGNETKANSALLGLAFSWAWQLITKLGNGRAYNPLLWF